MKVGDLMSDSHDLQTVVNLIRVLTGTRRRIFSMISSGKKSDISEMFWFDFCNCCNVYILDPPVGPTYGPNVFISYQAQNDNILPF